MNGGWPWLLVLALGSLTAFVVPARNRKLQWRMAGAFGLLVMTIVLGSCGVTQSKSWTTPTGQYSMTVTATAGSVSKAYTITLNIK